MAFFPHPLEIGDRDGFTKNDIFGRKAVGDGLTNLLSALSDPVVMAVNGEWGSGKTVFLKMWSGALRNQGYPVVYFDAFAHNYIGDAFAAIAGEIIDLEKQKLGKDDFKDKALAVGKVLLHAGVINAVKSGTGIVRSVGDVADGAKDAADKLLERVLSSRDEERLIIQAFRDALSALPASFCPPEEDEQGNPTPPRPLIFIIDELDRCRPSFALEVLERIKHFFAVPNVHFVLGVNVEQLENSVRAACGLRSGVKTYLAASKNCLI
jgi:predicted KAP-like P-loop ATPase